MELVIIIVVDIEACLEGMWCTGVGMIEVTKIGESTGGQGSKAWGRRLRHSA